MSISCNKCRLESVKCFCESYVEEFLLDEEGANEEIAEIEKLISGGQYE